MRHKKIVTGSGAKYVVYPGGTVERERGEHDIQRSAEGYQYDQGFLCTGVSYDDIVVGGPLRWMGVRFGKFTEPITSSTIKSVEEVEA